MVYFCCCSDKVADIETGLSSHCYHPWPSAAEEWHSLSFAWWVMYEELGRAYARVLWQSKRESWFSFSFFFLFLFPARSHRGSMHKRSWRSWIDHLWECTWVCMQAASSHKSVAPACARSLASAESAHLPSCEPVCVFCGCGSREGRWRRERERGVGGGGCWCANVHHVEGLWMGGCDVKRDPNAGAYLEAVKGTVCHIPGDYLSKTQHQLSFQETGRKSNFLDHSNRLVLKFFLFNSLSARSAFIISDSPYRICEWQAFFFLAPAFRCCHVQSTRTYSHLDFYRLLHLRSVDLRN